MPEFELVSENGRRQSGESGQQQYNTRRRERGTDSARHASEPWIPVPTRRHAHIDNAPPRRRCLNAGYEPASGDSDLQPTAVSTEIGKRQRDEMSEIAKKCARWQHRERYGDG